MPVVILEGVDCSGKTTLMKNAFADWHHVHLGPPPDPSYQERKDKQSTAFMQYRNKLINLVMSPEILPTVFDRFLYGESVYGPIMRKDSTFDRVHQRMLERVLLSLSSVVVYCDPPNEVVQQIWQDRVAQDLEYVTEPDKFRAIYNRYEELMSAEVALPVIRYDFTRHSFDHVIRLVRDRMTPKNQGPGIGIFKEGVTLLVGEQNNLWTATLDWPFFQDGGSSRWLTQQLEDMGVSENTLYWVNAVDHYDHPTSAAFVELLKPAKIVALGGLAAAWCRKAKLDFRAVSHPAYHLRFKRNEPYELQEALCG